MSAPTIPSGGIPVSPEIEVRQKDLFGGFSTLDHKRIGLMYLGTAAFFFAIAGFEAILMRLQLAWPRNSFLSPGAYNQTFTMHGTTMIFLVVVPTLLGLSVYLTPLMIGATDVAFPRLNAFGFWIFLFGGLLLLLQFLRRSGSGSGLVRLRATEPSRPIRLLKRTDYWITGAARQSGPAPSQRGLNLIVTIVKLRAPGMKLQKLPLFVWMVLVNRHLIILALPALNASLAMLLARPAVVARTSSAPGRRAADPLAALSSGFFGHPEVYIMVLPAFGIISRGDPGLFPATNLRIRIRGGSTVAIGLLSFGVWAHHMFAVGLGKPWDFAMAATSMLIAVPTGVKIFNWIATMWGGAIRFTTSMMFAIAFLDPVHDRWLERCYLCGGAGRLASSPILTSWWPTSTMFCLEERCSPSSRGSTTGFRR